MRAIEPMRAARRTLASGPTKSTKNPRPAKARPAAGTLGNRRLRAASSSAPRTRLQLAPVNVKLRGGYFLGSPRRTA
jgi:hypothetical protein